jgi:hypothetical protein
LETKRFQDYIKVHNDFRKHRKLNMSKLLKEAIADAKAVRETALANARLALEEAFAPRLQSMLTKKLKEEELDLEDDEIELEDDEEVEDVVADEEPAEAPAEEEPADEAPVEEPAAEEAPEDEVAAEDDLEAELSAEEDEDEAVEEDAFDLDSIIKELEDELASETDEDELEEQSDSSELGTGGEEHVNVADSDDEDLPDDTEVQSAPVGEEDDELEKVADIDEDIDIEIVDEEAPAGDESDEPTATESDEELAFPTEGVKEDNQGGDIGEDDEATDLEEDNQGGDIGEDDEEINLEEILKELEDESLEDEDEGSSEIEELKVKHTKLQKENDEYRKVYKYLRGKLNEVNLLNAKLLYTNKLFKQYGLTEDQKLKVVESFDLTKNVREAKLVYATLGESFRSSTNTKPLVASTPKARGKVIKKTLTEGMASKAIKSTKPSTKILTEGNDLANRFKKLAGIV